MVPKLNCKIMMFLFCCLGFSPSVPLNPGTNLKRKHDKIFILNIQEQCSLIWMLLANVIFPYKHKNFNWQVATIICKIGHSFFLSKKIPIFRKANGICYITFHICSFSLLIVLRKMFSLLKKVSVR